MNLDPQYYITPRLLMFKLLWESYALSFEPLLNWI